MEGRINPNYERVVPRDLFNEAMLLKCLGKLTVEILDGRIQGLKFYDSGIPFAVGTQADYLVLAQGLLIYTPQDNEPVWFGTTYNTKRAWPLLFFNGDDEERVFEEDGSFTEVFLARYKNEKEPDKSV